jgi:hypothetical protein
MKRALAVKLALQGYVYRAIENILMYLKLMYWSLD